MGRETSPYIIGDFWLDTRPDKRSPYWQIAWYDDEKRTTRYRSTGSERLDDAENAIRAHEAAHRAKAKQEVEVARAVPLLMLYWKEHGRKAINSSQIASSLRQFIAFLMQDAATIGVTVAGLEPPLFRRFVDWRSGPHEYALTWEGKLYEHESPGVTGESISRNLDDVRAAINHHVDYGRLLFSPKIPGINAERRSPPRDIRLSYAELGAIVGYCLYDIAMLRWVLGMIATGARPDAVLKWKVADQIQGPLFDTHPHGQPRTKKRNAVVPVIGQFRPWLEAWRDHPHPIVKSRKTGWRTMRDALGLRDEIVPKTIRHTVATELRSLGVPQLDVEGLLGHQMSNRVTAVYAKYDPARLAIAKQGLSTIWNAVQVEAEKWVADHYRTTPKKKAPTTIVKKAAKC